MFSRLPMALQVGEIGRQLATTITARTSFGKLRGLGEFGHRLFVHAQHAGNGSKTPALRMELAHLPLSGPGAGRGGTGGYALRAR